VSAIFILIPLGVVLLAAAVAAFIWAVDHDQFEDLDREGSRLLFDDDDDPPSS
jgi:cbb3-type cytochrome oxidase maturation protein